MVVLAVEDAEPQGQRRAEVMSGDGEERGEVHFLAAIRPPEWHPPTEIAAGVYRACAHAFFTPQRLGRLVDRAGTRLGCRLAKRQVSGTRRRRKRRMAHFHAKGGGMQQ